MSSHNPEIAGRNPTTNNSLSIQAARLTNEINQAMNQREVDPNELLPLMNMVAQVVVGRLVEIQWNYAFYIYAWSFIPFLVVLFLCPRFPVDRGDYSALGGSNSVLAHKGSLWNSIKHMPKNVWVFTIIVALYMLCYYPLFLVISPIIVDRSLGTAATAGDAMVFYSVATIIGGVVFGPVEKVMKHWTLAFFLICVAASLVGLYFAQSFAMVCFWLVISGITSTGIIPGCINVYNNQVADSDAFLATGITESGVNIGAFLTTPFIALIESLGGTAVQSLLLTPAPLVIMGVITAYFCKRAGSKAK